MFLVSSSSTCSATSFAVSERFYRFTLYEFYEGSVIFFVSLLSSIAVARGIYLCTGYRRKRTLRRLATCFGWGSCLDKDSGSSSRGVKGGDVRAGARSSEGRASGSANGSSGASGSCAASGAGGDNSV